MAKEKKFFMWQWKWSKMEGGDGYTILNRPKAIEWCKQVNQVLFIFAFAASWLSSAYPFLQEVMFEFFSALDQGMHDISYPITDSWEPMVCTTTLGAPGLFQENFDIRILKEMDLQI